MKIKQSFTYKEVLEIVFTFGVDKKRLTKSKLGKRHAEMWLKIHLIERISTK
jgi:hypothetical protein